MTTGWACWTCKLCMDEIALITGTVATSSHDSPTLRAKLVVLVRLRVVVAAEDRVIQQIDILPATATRTAACLPALRPCRGLVAGRVGRLLGLVGAAARAQVAWGDEGRGEAPAQAFEPLLERRLTRARRMSAPFLKCVRERAAKGREGVRTRPL